MKIRARLIEQAKRQVRPSTSYNALHRAIDPPYLPIAKNLTPEIYYDGKKRETLVRQAVEELGDAVFMSLDSAIQAMREAANES